jgi:type IV pilus modification protein PilV
MSPEGGFTLIEAVIAIAVVTIGVLAINAMQTGAVRGNAKANQITSVSTWAGNYMEQVNAMDYDDLVDTDGDGTDQDADGNGIDDDGGNFGLDDIDANADFTDATHPSGLFTLYANVAEDYPIQAVKTVRIIVVRNTDQQQFVFNYAKSGNL